MLLEFALLCAVGISGALGLRVYAVQAFFIPSGSMEQTLHGCEGCDDNDRIVVDKLRYKWSYIKRGDIVVFTKQGTPFENNPQIEKDLVKRVIGIPGDVLQCCDAEGRVVRNGQSLVEPYVFQDDSTSFGPVRIPQGYVFVMGDHRSNSTDSRLVGPVPISAVVGKAVFRFWPPSRIGPID